MCERVYVGRWAKSKRATMLGTSWRTHGGITFGCLPAAWCGIDTSGTHPHCQRMGFGPILISVSQRESAKSDSIVLTSLSVYPVSTSLSQPCIYSIGTTDTIFRKSRHFRGSSGVGTMGHAGNQFGVRGLYTENEIDLNPLKAVYLSADIHVPFRLPAKDYTK